MNLIVADKVDSFDQACIRSNEMRQAKSLNATSFSTVDYIVRNSVALNEIPLKEIVLFVLTMKQVGKEEKSEKFPRLVKIFLHLLSVQ